MTQGLRRPHRGSPLCPGTREDFSFHPTEVGASRRQSRPCLRSRSLEFLQGIYCEINLWACSRLFRTGTALPERYRFERMKRPRAAVVCWGFEVDEMPRGSPGRRRRHQGRPPAGQLGGRKLWLDSPPTAASRQGEKTTASCDQARQSSTGNGAGDGDYSSNANLRYVRQPNGTCECYPRYLFTARRRQREEILSASTQRK
jgi:hypothetical protein